MTALDDFILARQKPRVGYVWVALAFLPTHCALFGLN